MRTALISDIHGNLEALKTVMADIKHVGVDRILCLGDTVGYGPQPQECLDIVSRNCDVVLMGNHEYSVIHGAVDFTPLAEEALLWTAHQLQSPALLQYLRDLPASYAEDDLMFVHGSIYDPINDYVREAESAFMFNSLVNTLREDFHSYMWVFVGHNHRTFLGTEIGYLFPHDDTEPPQTEFCLAGQRAYISIGSVGQPRDGDPRASWVLLENDTVTFHRIPYDYRRTADLIRQVGLPRFLARRLATGT